MTDFDDRPFVQGSLVGLRSFRVDSLGRLTGVSFKSVWVPGVNEAGCSAGTRFLKSLPSSMQGLLTYTSVNKPFLPLALGNTPQAAESPPKEHVLAGVGCRCGFYAYFDEGSNPHHFQGNVLALIEGYGVCTVGSRGFRCSKARLLGFVQEPRLRWWRRIHPGLLRIWLGLVPATVVAVWLSLSDGVDAFATRLTIGVWAFAATVAAIGTYAEKIAGNLIAPPRRPIPDAVLENYPDVPVYQNLADALAAHPLILPERPTAASDPEFWTRAA